MSRDQPSTDALDERFVQEQYRAHATAVYRKCLVLGGGNRQWAEDVTQDVFVRLLERLPEIDRTDNVGGWLRAVALRLCIDRLRRERSIWARVKEKLTAADPPPDQTEPESVMRVKALLAQLEGLMHALSAKERAVLVMRYLDGAKQHEIARALGLSEGYVSKLLARALQRARETGWEVADD